MVETAEVAVQSASIKNPKRNSYVIYKVFSDGKKILIDSKGRQLYTLNDVAADIWMLLDGSRSLQDLVKEMLREYIVEERTLLKDVEDLITELESLGLLEHE